MGLASSKETARIATPKIIAEYRAKRLACGKIVDIGAGIGGQSVALSRTCNQVISVEKDAASAALLRTNVASLGLPNIEVLEGDFFSTQIQERVRGADTYFCDTSRPLGEEMRSIEKIEPSPAALVSACTDVAIEIPPQLPPERIPFDAEKEYISFEYRLNRLTLYFGKLRQGNVRVVSLPSGAVLDDSMPARELENSGTKKFLHEVDTSVMKAGLLGQLAASIPQQLWMLSQWKYTYLTSLERIDSPFLKSFRVIDTVSEEDVNKALAHHHFGKAVLHLPLDPKEYWSRRTAFEKGLKGEKTGHVFAVGGRFIITERI